MFIFPSSLVIGLYRAAIRLFFPLAPSCCSCFSTTTANQKRSHHVQEFGARTHSLTQLNFARKHKQHLNVPSSGEALLRKAVVNVLSVCTDGGLDAHSAYDAAVPVANGIWLAGVARAAVHCPVGGLPT